MGIAIIDWYRDSVKRLIVGITVMIMVGAALITTLSSVKAETLHYKFQFAFGSGVGQLTGVAVDRFSGNIVVTDSQNNHILAFDPQGAFLKMLGSPGSDDGQFNGLAGMAIDPTTSNIVVADTANNRIQIFTSSGTLVRVFGSPGCKDGQFSAPRMLAINPSSSNIVVTDTDCMGAEGFQVFTADGAFIAETRISFGAGGGYLGSLAVEPSTGHILVNVSRCLEQPLPSSVPGKQCNNGIDVFAADGSYLGEMEIGANSITVDPRTGKIVEYVIADCHVQIFMPGGTKTFGECGNGDGQFNPSDHFDQGSDVTIDPTNGNFVVIDSGNHRIQIFSPDGMFIRVLKPPQTVTFQNPKRIAIDPRNRNIIVTDNGNSRVQVFSANGTLVRAFGENGSGEGQFNGLVGVAVDPTNGDILAVDENNQRIEVFTADGEFIRAIGSHRELGYPTGVAIDPTNRNIVVADYSNDRLQVFTPDGIFLKTIALESNGYRPSTPIAVAIDPATGNILVADNNNNRILIMTSTGTLVRALGAPLGKDWDFGFTADVSVDPTSSNIIVTDYVYCRVQVFTGTGAFITGFGSRGVGNGQFNDPSGAAVDPTNGNILVVDSNNHRIEIFSQE